MTRTGKEASFGDLLMKSFTPPHSYAGYYVQNKPASSLIIESLKSKLDESRFPTPPVINRVG